MKLVCFNPFRVRDLFALLLYILPMGHTMAQRTLPFIRASSTQVLIKDGYVIREGVWNLSPEAKPDVYTAIEPNTAKTITFYTDLDSIAVRVNPGNHYDFYILLNQKDTCYTRISVGERPADQRSEPLLNPEWLAMDFVVFRDYLQKKHPGLYRYRAKSEVKRLLDSCLLSINRPLTKVEFAKKILFMTSAIQDGHTGTNFFSFLGRHYQEQVKLLPLNLYFTESKAYIGCSKSGQFEAGTELVSINNRPISALRKELFRYLPSDGSIETKKTQTLNNGAFPFLYRWIVGHGDSISVGYRTRVGTLKSTTLAAAFVTDFECEFSSNPSRTNVLELSYPLENAALLTIKTFDENRLRNAGLDYKNFLRQSFSALRAKNTENLIIDLRGNAGGLDEYGALLYSYLAEKPFAYYAAVESTSKTYSASENRLLGKQPVPQNVFKGRVFFLINGLSFSTTADFCAIARSNQRGQFIGEETGGGYYGNTSGQTLKIELPHSKINLIIPQFSYVNDVKKVKHPDRGVLPDYGVTATVDDLLHQKDVPLQVALDLLRKK